MKVKDLKPWDKISYQDKEYIFVSMRWSHWVRNYKWKETIMLYRYDNVLLINTDNGRQKEIKQDVLSEHQNEPGS